jgi:hypothetical protein
MHPSPVFEEAEEVRTRTEPRPVRDARGQPITRLGVRYDQIFALALATLVEGG